MPSKTTVLSIRVKGPFGRTIREYAVPDNQTHHLVWEQARLEAMRLRNHGRRAWPEMKTIEVYR